MSITDELRKQLLYHTPAADASLIAIADRIDKEHQKAEDEWKAKDGQTWLRGYAECHAELMEGNEVIAADLEKAGWVRLPKDADGVPIHIGDRLVEPEYVPNGGTVVGIKRYMSCDHWLVNCGAWVDPRKCRHYHKPTVEDVLREFAFQIGQSATDDDIVTEYAEKLREVVEHERD